VLTIYIYISSNLWYLFTLVTFQQLCDTDCCYMLTHQLFYVAKVNSIHNQGAYTSDSACVE